MNLETKKNYNLSFLIIIINIIVFFLSLILYNMEIIRLNLYLGLNPTLFVEYKHYWTPITYMFAHGNISHLFFNMFALFIFGHSLEQKMGSIPFITYYFVTGVLAGLFSLLLYWFFHINVLLIGASGAIYALLFAYAVFYPNRKLYFWGIVPISPPVLILIYTAIDLYSQIFGSTNIAHLTHLSGLLFAYLFFRLVYKINPLFIFMNYKKFTK
ncbi:rhomboid family intramembrane serine protease [Thiospirochaeta perfilievii]|uniref:Rhomboid family intramembrane serine protease n=1 Tax=Thiospirochaeta perfilievii TaxID=252967 RepID=A0A5C1QFB0_9SPIO|nr:rhomboid family intramembrane serine protease [Thiospirochaeta perfilievii]QEN04882.1 rhomboid family intramembrane serine protease [Thiospirochaeta perfilievii]